LTNEKRGGLKLVAFDRSPFKLLTLSNDTKFNPPLFSLVNTFKGVFYCFVRGGISDENIDFGSHPPTEVNKLNILFSFALCDLFL
jgi:hypothetical protein